MKGEYFLKKIEIAKLPRELIVKLKFESKTIAN